MPNGEKFGKEGTMEKASRCCEEWCDYRRGIEDT